MAVSCKEHDFLDQDPEIRGQKYFCMSTISPEDVLLQKESYMFSQFLAKGFTTDFTTFFENMAVKFKDDKDVMDMLTNLKERHGYVTKPDELQAEYDAFKRIHADKLESEFHKLQEFRTTIRGIKIRGVYDSIAEARARAEKLSRIDKNFNIYIGEVGCWCPWSPYPDEIGDQEFAETQLNTLMKKYKETQELKDELYKLRHDEMVKKASIVQNTGSTQVVDDSAAAATNSVVDDTDDIWLQRKNELAAAE